MDYNESLEYIHSISNFFCKPGLERIKELCNKLGNPQDFLKFIHVAGTNGKGSFCAMLSSVLKEAGYKTGLYTSPYILKFNERITINGEMIDNNSLAEITTYVRKYAETMEDKPTEFELITAIAFEYFKRENCDIVVLECGMGGLLDATNIIKTPIISVITGVSIDHTSFLGDTIEEIAGEKAGIVKQGIPCLWCGDNKVAEKVIRNYALSQNSKIVDADKTYSVREFSLNGTVFSTPLYNDIYLPLLGSYQPQNACNVLSAVSLLNELEYNISESHIRNGFKNTVWHARFEVLSKNPLIIADGAHNPEGIDSAVDSIKQYFKDKKVNIITGVMKDKDYLYIAKILSEIAHTVFCVTPDNPRALSAKEYSKVFINLNVKALDCDSVEDAVVAAVNGSKNTGCPVLALGSLYMYSQIFDTVEKFYKK
jgi:dihydrofolate synthase/folylpolyglutamate synthase